jgi:agmatinase
MTKPLPCIVGLPWDAGSSFLRGAAKAPPLIRKALHHPDGNSWTEGLHDIAASGALMDVGDLQLSAVGTTARSEMESAIGDLLRKECRPIALGGDHSVTYPVMRAVSAAYPRVTLLWIDAHPDLYEEFEGDRHSHACPCARVMEENLASRLVQVGIRTMTQHQKLQAARFDAEIIDMRAWAGGVRPHCDGAVYVSIDLDALDPAHAPGVSHREPGGLTVREVIHIIQTTGGTLIGADVVEFNPLQDHGDLTARVAAKLVKELVDRMIQDGES